MPQPPARTFAEGWIAAWNAHGLDAVLAHISDDFEFFSPNIVRIVGEPSGKLQRAKRRFAPIGATLVHWSDPHFELVDAPAGIGCLLILSYGHRGLSAEVFEIDARDLAVHGRCAVRGVRRR